VGRTMDGGWDAAIRGEPPGGHRRGQSRVSRGGQTEEGRGRGKGRCTSRRSNGRASVGSESADRERKCERECKVLH
jgi:hypothetical protein